MTTTPARTLVRGIALLEAVAAHPEGVGVSELAGLTHLDKGTASRLLTSLRELGYVRQRADRRYELAGQCAWLGDRYRVGRGDLAAACAPFLALLSSATRETALVAIQEGMSVVHLAESLPDRLIRVSTPIGAAMPLWPSAVGRVMLSVMSPEERRTVMATPVPDANDREEDARNLAAVGWVMSHDDDVSQIAVPFIDRAGRPAALAIAGPTHRIADRAPDLAGQVVEAALQLSLELARTAGAVHPSYEAERSIAVGDDPRTL